MRILDLTIGRFTHNCASTTVVTLAVFVSACLGGVIRFIEQVRGN
jgi:hypothetical protein